MDKNNDIKVNKVNKWDYGVVDMSLWHLKDEFDALVDKLNGVYGIDVFEIEELTADTRSSMDKVLDRFNELEVEHQKESGMISQYEEENRNLKSELDIKTDECDALISRVFKQDEEYTKLEAENEKLRSQRKSKEDALKKMVQEVTDLEKEKIDLEDRLVQQKRLEVRARVNASTASTYRSEIKQVIDLAKSYGLIIYDDRKDAIPDDVVNIGMCGHYYVLSGCAKKEKEDALISQYEEENQRLREPVNKLINARIELTRDNDDLRRECDRHIDLLDKLRWALLDKGIHVEWSEAALKWNLYYKNKPIEELKQHYEDELRIRCKEIDDKNKLIEELTHENRVFRLKNLINRTYGPGQIALLNKEIHDLRMENKNLKYLEALQEKNENFGKYVGERVADSIREGHDKGVYKLHPLTRIDIHVEEIKDVPLTFASYSIPRISVIFNNTQTEMERDTAQHECEELNEKIKELSKENVDLKTTLAMCEQDANMAQSLCHNIAFNAERARNKPLWVKAGIRF